jgi:hypothetical protein
MPLFRVAVTVSSWARRWRLRRRPRASGRVFVPVAAPRIAVGRRAAIIVVMVALVSAGCFSVERLPPPAAPTQVVPPIDRGGPPAPGLGRVVLDVEGDQATVFRVTGGSVGASGAGAVFSGSLEVTRPLCVTPCQVDLTPGPHGLRFVSRTDDDRRGDAFINIDQATSVYRYKLGRRSRPYGRRTLAWLTGAVGAFSDVAALATIDNDRRSIPITYGVVGVALTGLSWWLFRTSGFVEQSGAGTQWSLPPTGP